MCQQVWWMVSYFAQLINLFGIFWEKCIFWDKSTYLHLPKAETNWQSITFPSLSWVTQFLNAKWTNRSNPGLDALASWKLLWNWHMYSTRQSFKHQMKCLWIFVLKNILEGGLHYNKQAHLMVLWIIEIMVYLRIKHLCIEIFSKCLRSIDFTILFLNKKYIK